MNNLENQNQQDYIKQYNDCYNNSSSVYSQIDTKIMEINKKYNEPPPQQKLAVNIPEILTTVLQQVLSKENLNDISIESILSKIRQEYECRRIFTNKKNIMLLNFDDDTFMPIIKTINKDILDIILGWYSACDILVDIEDIKFSIPENISEQQFNNILFKYIDVKHKDTFIQNYLPMAINKFISEDALNMIEKKIFGSIIDTTNNSNLKENKNTIYPYSSVDVSFSNNNYLKEKYSIIVPEELQYNGDLYYKLDDGKIKKMNETRSKTKSSTDLMNRYHSIESTEPFEYNQVDYYDISGNEQIYFGKKETEMDIINKINNNDNICKLGYYQPNSIFSDAMYIYIPEEPNKDKQDKYLIHILFNLHFMRSICIINANKITLEVIEKHSNQFGFTRILTHETSNIKIVDAFKSEFNNKLYDRIDEFNISLLTIASFVSINNQHISERDKICIEEKSIKEFINNNYTITTNLEHRLKASDIQEFILNSNKCQVDKEKISGFKNRLSKYLKDMGLEKKRYNDGYYYYGLEPKLTNRNFEEIFI
jgi:hypothetical protein